MITAAVVIFLAFTASAFLALRAGESRSRQRIRDRVDGVLAPVTDYGGESARDDFPPSGKRAPFEHLDKAIRNFNFHRKIANELRKANLSWRVSEFLSLSLSAATFPALMVHALLHRPMVTGMMIVAGAAFPLLLIRRKQAARRKAFAIQLLDAVTLISNSLKSGYSFLQSIDLVARELPAPISEEFRKVLHEIKYGITFEDAVASLIERMENEDLDLIMTCVIIQRQVGGNLAEILDKIAFTIRERIRIRGQIKTLTAQGRLSGLILSLLPVGLALFLFLINPQYISVLYTRTVGFVLLGFAGVSQLIGMVLIRKIVDIKV